MDMTLHGTNENVVQTINLDSLVDHNDHSGMCDGVYVCNHSFYSKGIGVPGFLVKTVNINKAFTIVDYKNVRANNTGVCM